MMKRTLLLMALMTGCWLTAAPQADAGIFVRRAPVRRIAARAVLPPYPLARRAVVGPVYRPYYRPYYSSFGYGGYGYGGYGYGPGVSVGIGF